MVQDMDPPNDNAYFTKPEKCCQKLLKKSMVDTTPSWKDGTTTKDTAILCRELNGLNNKLSNTTNWLSKIIHMLRQKKKEFASEQRGY